MSSWRIFSRPIFRASLHCSGFPAAALAAHHDYLPEGTQRTASAMTWPSVPWLEIVRLLELPALKFPVAIFTQPPWSRWFTFTASLPEAPTISTGTLVARFLFCVHLRYTS